MLENLQNSYALQLPELSKKCLPNNFNDSQILLRNYELGQKELKKLIDDFFDKNGFPKNRNCENLIGVLQYFVLIKEWIKLGQEIVPDYLDDIINKNLIQKQEDYWDSCELFNKFVLYKFPLLWLKRRIANF